MRHNFVFYVRKGRTTNELNEREMIYKGYDFLWQVRLPISARGQAHSANISIEFYKLHSFQIFEFTTDMAVENA